MISRGDYSSSVPACLTREIGVGLLSNRLLGFDYEKQKKGPFVCGAAAAADTVNSHAQHG